MTTNLPNNPLYRPLAPIYVPISWFSIHSNLPIIQPHTDNEISSEEREQQRLKDEHKQIKRENNQEYWHVHKQKIKQKRVLQQAGIQKSPDHSEKVQELETVIQDCVGRGNTYWTTLHNVRHYVRKHFPRRVKKGHCQDQYLTTKQKECGTIAKNRRARMSQFMSQEHFDQVWHKCLRQPNI